MHIQFELSRNTCVDLTEDNNENIDNRKLITLCKSASLLERHSHYLIYKFMYIRFELSRYTHVASTEDYKLDQR